MSYSKRLARKEDIAVDSRTLINTGVKVGCCEGAGQIGLQRVGQP